MVSTASEAGWAQRRLIAPSIRRRSSSQLGLLLHQLSVQAPSLKALGGHLNRCDSDLQSPMSPPNRKTDAVARADPLNKIHRLKVRPKGNRLSVQRRNHVLEFQTSLRRRPGLEDMPYEQPHLGRVSTNVLVASKGKPERPDSRYGRRSPFFHYREKRQAHHESAGCETEQTNRCAPTRGSQGFESARDQSSTRRHFYERMRGLRGWSRPQAVSGFPKRQNARRRSTGRVPERLV